MVSTSSLLLGATALLNLLPSVEAQASVAAPASIVYRWATTPSSPASDDLDLYLHISAPTSLQWVALGTGHRMRNSDIFMLYTDGTGNITLSTRTSDGHVGTYFTDRLADSVTLLPGSGIADGRMTANILCRDSCGGLDLSGGSDKWIAGWRGGDALDTTDLDASAAMHDDARVYEVDYTVAAAANFDPSSPFDSVQGGTVGVTSVNDPLPTVHALLMSLSFLILYPIGAIIMPLFGRWLLHAVWQVIAFVVMWAGFAVGYISASQNEFYFDEVHTRFGTIVVALLAAQPVLGWLHHAHFQKYRARGAVSYAHIWYGRTLMVLGVVNGGLGLRLVGEAPDGPFLIGYVVVTGVFTLAYLGSIAWKQVKKRRTLRTDSPEMTTGFARKWFH